MEFIEFPQDYNMMYVLALFSSNTSLTNEQLLEYSIITENADEHRELSKYSNGIQTLKDSKFKINISMFNAIDDLISNGYATRDNETKTVTITEKGTKLYGHYANVPHFEQLCKYSNMNRLDINLDWSKFSKDLIELLNINKEKYIKKHKNSK